MGQSKKEDEVVSVLTEISEIARDHEVDYIEACVEYCEIYDIEDIEGLAKIVKSNANFMEKIRQDAEKFNLIEKRQSTANNLFEDS